MILVYHNKDFNSVIGYKMGVISAEDLHENGEYILVAAVATCKLEEAYSKTQHKSGNWSENQGVTLRSESRSTSIGDILISPGGTYVVSAIGFYKIRDFVA